MRPPKQKQPQVKKGLCRVLEDEDIDRYRSIKLLRQYKFQHLIGSVVLPIQK